jgi:hypothetical protein
VKERDLLKDTSVSAASSSSSSPHEISVKNEIDNIKLDSTLLFLRHTNSQDRYQA